VDIKKSGEQVNVMQTGMPSSEDLVLIHNFTRKKMTTEELYCFSVKLCDNEIDRDGERFTTKCLHGLQKLFIGKTGMFDHSGKSHDQVMRIYDTYMEENGQYAALCAKVYLPRSEGNKALIGEIDAGIKKEVSVGCAVRRVKCSICGKAISKCEHKKGVVYGNKTCHAILEDPTDAYEFSFVAVPAQQNAGVLKKRKSAASAYIQELERLAQDGRMYRAELMEQALKAATTAMPEVDRMLLQAMCKNLDTPQLKKFHDTMREKAAKSLPICSQLVQGVTRRADNKNFRV